MADWNLYPVAENLGISVVRPMPKLAAWLDAAVDDVWQSEQIRLGGVLFNGRVFSADVITPGLVCGHWTEYRRIVAQMRRPDLHPHLGIRPVAVGGIILGPDGVLFGRRPVRAVYQAGEWQLPPAGNVDLTCARAEGAVDVAAMLLTEMEEELGLLPRDVSDIRPVAFIEHPLSHVLDLGMAARTDLRAAELLAAHASGGNAEYDPLVAVSLAELPAFLAGGSVTRQAPMFLAHMGLITL